MELIVAEKPRVAEKIASAIGDKVEKKAYEGVSYYEVVRNGKQIAIAPAVGHVYSLVEKEKSRGYPAFDIEWVPAYRASKEAAYTRSYVELIQKLGRKADTFVSACDYDIEGSTIAWNVFRFATTIREGRRMKFSALTQSDLTDAYEQRGDFDYNNAYAGEARHILDWFYGINLSRALMGSLRAASRYRVLSIGRVQGPALGLLSSLEKDIRAFVPTPYWELTIHARGAEFSHVRGRFQDEKEAEAALSRTADSATVRSVDRKEQQVPPMPCFDLTSLQLEAYRLFKYAPSRVLELSQALYEASLITYPRTSSQKIPPSINLPKIIASLSSNPEYAPLAKKIASEKWFRPVQGKKEDPAHPAIHPTGQAPGSMDAAEKNLYDLIVRRFLAAFAPPATREKVRVELDAGGEGYSASGSRLTGKGWTEFYGKYYTSEDTEVPAFTQGERVGVEKKKKTAKETKPPKRYSQASLVSELEDRHLGTKSTRAVIIDTLLKRGYAGGTASIEVSDFGLKVCEVLQKYAPEILDENLTRRLEDEMEGIQEGKIAKEQVIADGKEILTGILGRWKANEAKIGADLAEALKATMEQENMVGVCDKCGKNLRIIRLGAGRQFIGCTGYPACRNAYPLPGGAFVKVTGKPCPQCGKPTIFVKRSGGRPFTMCIDPKCPSKADWGRKKEAVAVQAAKPAVPEKAPEAGAEKKKPVKPARKPARKAVAAGGTQAVPGPEQTGQA